jgi:NAD(P)-dependent dehydrogenase (short-subunit alcohol dehydrogenase family)/acyl carrier protein
MLDVDMDLESDLGIDSIKRVEIFARLKEVSGSGMSANAEGGMETLTTLKTLRQIIEFVGEQKGSSIDERPKSTVVAVETDNHPGARDITQRILSVVSEKTGYPADMLDIDMDLESDLGIDSIKRIEVFSRLQETLPVVSSIDRATVLQTLGALKTLREIVAYVTSITSPASGPKTADVATLDGLFPADEEKKKPASRIRRFVPGISELGTPTLINSTELNANGKWLLISDGTGIATEIQKQLSVRGIECVCLNPFTKTPSSHDEKTFALQSLSEEAVSEVLHQISREHGAIRGLVYEHPYREEKGKTKLAASFIEEREIELIKALFLIVKTLKRELTETVEGMRNAILFVTRYDGQLGTTKKRLFPVVSGGLYGFVKSLHWEWPNVFCRIIDVSPELEVCQATGIVMDELCDRDLSLMEVGINNNAKRVSLTLTEKQENGAVKKSETPDQTSLFVVSGGGRGITADCVVGLANKFKSKFVLVGRTSMDEDEWSVGCYEEEPLKARALKVLSNRNERVTPVKLGKLLRDVRAKRQIRETIRQIEKCGGSAKYITADITNEGSLRSALSSVGATESAITGIVHGAGNLSDKRIENKTAQDFDSVFNTKVKGLRALLCCTDPLKLRHLVVFSSVAGYFGNAGQTDYAAANEVFNKFVYAYNALYPQCNTVSMNWGPWDSGMVTHELKEIYRKRNIDVIESSVGVEHLCAEVGEFHDDHHQVIVGGANLALGAFEGSYT